MTTDTRTNPTPRQSPWRIAGWGTALCLLLVPALAMQLTDDVRWGVEDFAFATVMIGGVGLMFELAVRLSSNIAYRLGFALGLLAIFITVWVQMAVGIIGEPENSANLMFFGIVGLAIVGSLIARFKARGMAWTMAAAAFVQINVGIATYSAEPVMALFTPTMTLIWLSAAGLFFKASQAAPAED